MDNVSNPGFNGFSPVATFIKDFDLRIFLEQPTKITSCQGFVVDDQSSYSLNYDSVYRTENERQPGLICDGSQRNPSERGAVEAVNKFKN